MKFYTLPYEDHKYKKREIVSLILCTLVMFVGVLAFMSALWYITTYENIGFFAIIFTLTVDNGSAEQGLIFGYILKALIPTILITAVLMFVLRGKLKKMLGLKNDKTNKSFVLFPMNKTLSSVVAIVLVLTFLISAASMVSFPQYVMDVLDKTTFYDKEYIDPNTVNITFPEEKRNVIYIMLESMETTFFSKEETGGLEYNVIPELYELAEDNLNFSHNEGIGGWPVVTNATWTIASIVSQTGGIPLSVPLKRNTYGKTADFLPGLTSVTNILDENGYYQAVMFGSDGNYAGRDQYYLQHGADVVYDLFSAREEGIVPKDYKVWWGMEDLHLYNYAKKKLVEIAEKDQPFMFSMLTVDTHHVSGYKCELCGDKYDEQYENVYACASKQLAEFVEWIKQQPFYENTTIIVCGDHCSMDNEYFSRNFDDEYERHMYNCFINSVAETDNTKNRVFTPMDMFPTTLAAIGCTIEGERLGLGTNLFSDTPTLAEKYSVETINEELGKTSSFYMKKFVKSK